MSSGTALPPSFFDEARRWIGLDTVTSRSNRALADRAGALLRPLGFAVRLRRVVEGGVPFFNLLARRGPAFGRPLLLNTHTDTVPPGPADRWTSTGGDPFRLARRDGFLFGLGAADVKLNLLCQIEALRRLGDVPFRRPVCVAGTYGEERGMRGARRLIRSWRGPKPFLALVGEPSELRPVLRHRGYLVLQWDLPPGPVMKVRGRVPLFRVRVEGKSAHSSTPELGVNAFLRGFDLLDRLERLGLRPRVAAAAGGTAPNQVPAEASFDVVLPGWPSGLPRGVTARRSALAGPASVTLAPWRAVRDGVARLAASLPASHSMNLGLLSREGGRTRAVLDLRFPPEGSAGELAGLARAALGPAGRLSVLTQDPPLNAPASGGAAALLKKALRGAGLPVRLDEKATCTEAGLYHAWGVPAAVFGPGRSRGNVHRPNERVSVADLAKAADFYEVLLRLWATS